MDLRNDEKWMLRGDAVGLMTMWLDDTTWVPLVESETADITGPGHIDPEVFAQAVNTYDSDMGSVATTSASEVTHQWVRAAVNDAGEWRSETVRADDPNAIPVTTVWGTR